MVEGYHVAVSLDINESQENLGILTRNEDKVIEYLHAIEQGLQSPDATFSIYISPNVLENPRFQESELYRTNVSRFYSNKHELYNLLKTFQSKKYIASDITSTTKL